MLGNRIKSLWTRRKAVSPVIATILLIALTVTAAAIVYFVVVPLLRGNGELVVMDYDLEDTDDTPFADTLTVDFNNIGTAEAVINVLTVTRDGVSLTWNLEAETITIPSGSSIDVECTANDATMELGYGVTAVFTFGFGGDTISIEIKVPAQFSHFVLQYDNDFETATDLSEWIYTKLGEHSGGTSYNSIQDWRITEQSGNHYAECTSNDCQFIILEDPLYDFYDVNISYDLRTGDDDGNGIIYRYDDSGTYPNFYCVWFTREHPGASNPSTDGGHDSFDWATPGDIVVENKLTIHYVEGDADGFNWYKIAEASWTRANNVWYSWRVVADGSNGAIYIDNSATATLSWTDARLSHGYVGFISFANLDSDFDNIYVWQTVSS